MDFDEDPDYLDLDDILAQAQTVDAKFLFNIPGLEFLSSSQAQGVTQTANILLPFWMAKTLYTYSMIDIELPANYKQTFREKLEIDVDIVDLHRNGPHYYRFGKLLLGLKREKGNNLDMYTQEGLRNKFRREEGETLEDRHSIAKSLIDTFHRRRHKLLEYSTNPAKDGGEMLNVRAFESRLDNMEKCLFQLGRQQVEETMKWNTRKIEMISSNQIAVELAKKRRKLEASTNKPETTT